MTMGEVRPIPTNRARGVEPSARVEADDDICLATASCQDTIAPRPMTPPVPVPPNIDLELLEPAISLRDLMRLQQQRGGGSRRTDPAAASRAEARRFEQERARREEERRRLEYDRSRQP